jgi:hypothetical protein
MHPAGAAEREKSATVGMSAGLSGSGRKGQLAFRRDPLMLLAVALDAIHRITGVAIRLRHELAHLVRARHRSLQHPWHEYHGLPNQKLVLHGENPFGDGKSERMSPDIKIYGDAAPGLRARGMPLPVDSPLRIV